MHFLLIHVEVVHDIATLTAAIEQMTNWGFRYLLVPLRIPPMLGTELSVTLGTFHRHRERSQTHTLSGSSLRLKPPVNLNQQW